MPDIVTTQIFTDGEKGITATKMNNIVADSVIQPDFYNNKATSPTLDPTDQLLELKGSGSYARITGSQLISSVGSQMNIGPVIVGGAAGTTPVSVGSILVPAYANHPDAIWTYGTYDDHFDISPLNAKWTQVIGSGGSINVSGSRVHLFSPNTPTYITQPVPTAQSFTVSAKFESAGVLAAVASEAGFIFELYSSTNSSLRLQIYYSVVSSFGMTYNTQRQCTWGGVSAGTNLSNNIWANSIPPYWRLQFNYSTRATTIYYSFDAVTWIQLASYTGANSAFTTYPPVTCDLQAYSTANSNALVAVDWFKLTTP